MSQPSVASFFNTRKRVPAEDAQLVSKKVLLDSETECPYDQQQKTLTVITRSRSERANKRRNSSDLDDEAPRKISRTAKSLKQPKLVQFVKKGNLSPCKKIKAPSKQSQQTDESNKPAVVNKMESGMKTPVKQIIKEDSIKPAGAIKALVKKELSFNEVKSKISRSEKLQELKASLNRIKELEKTRKSLENRNRRLQEGDNVNNSMKKDEKISLKEFDTIELEVLTSPVKFKTPIKQIPPPTPDKNELMSPKHTKVAKRILFSPSKDGSPSKLIIPPAYERFSNLSETSATKAGSLPLPFKYRQLLEIFKSLDYVCAMFYNRKECITFKKLKPVVQRMLRKNFNESHLAQIKYLYPDAFIFSQMKMRNYGSASKADYFQLVILPNIEGIPQGPKLQQIDEENIMKSAQSNAMNPQMIVERVQKFQLILLNKVKDEHEQFLLTLVSPLIISKDKITRWHPEFDLENCTDIPLGHLPQPPNVEKYSSARDILSTARNLFNCATPLERAMERYEAKFSSDASESVVNPQIGNINSNQEQTDPKCNEKEPPLASCSVAKNEVASATDALLKGVPKSLLERIRAKQAAKALDAITRRPSQDQEAAKYSRLPELCRHLRNVFVTEKKCVLTLETVIKKIQNSFRTSLTPQEIEYHLKLLAKECPEWITFHEVRKTLYIKISKDVDMNKIVDKLEKVANEKSK